MNPSLLLLTFLFFFFTSSSLAAPISYNVVNLGAKPDGKTDSTQPFLTAWSKACLWTQPATIYVPPGRFLIRNVLFDGRYCKNTHITFLLDHTTLINKLTANSWISFEHVNGVYIHGTGSVLDGQGSSLWDCKKSGRSGCPSGTMSTLAFSDSRNVVISGLTSINSQMYHFVILGCNNVKMVGVTASAPGDSPNTDGIHVQYSTAIDILHSRIGTGDDCVSIGPGTTNLWIEDLACGPGHGISIGSLGKDLKEPGVQNVTVKTVTFTGTQNGVRIKTWGKPSNGFVKDISFQHAIMNNVENPIIVDQNYCPSKKHCPGQASGVKISGVAYKDIHGTSATQVAVKFDCSSRCPCSRITMEDIKLTYNNKPAEASCIHAGGSASGFVQPSSCLEL